MQRFFLLIMTTLSIFVTLAAGSAVWQTAGLARGGPAIDAADPAVADAFYRALDRVMTGERDNLSDIVTNDFVDYSEIDAAGSSAETLVERLQAFGENFPGARMNVERVQASGDTLVAVVSHEVPLPAQVAGVTLSSKPADSGIEILRVQRGLVSERWAASQAAPLLTTFEEATIESTRDATLTARLFRVTFAAGQELKWRGDTPALALVETGAIVLSTQEHLDDPVKVTRQNKTIAAGTAVPVPHGATIRAEDDTDQIAQFLFFSTVSTSSNALGTFRLHGGAKSELLWKSSAPFSVAGPWSVDAGRVALLPGSEIELGDMTGRALILAAQGEPLHLTTEGATLVHLDERYRMSAVESPYALPAGGAMHVWNTSSASLGSSSSDALVWLISIGQIDPVAGDAGLLPTKVDDIESQHLYGPQP